MAEKKIVMAWSKCTVEIGDTGEDDDSMATSWSSVGKTKDKSTTLSSEDGDKLEMKASGGETVGSEKNEGTFSIVTRVIEPSDELYTELGLGEVDKTNSDEFNVKTHVCPKEKSVKITPKNIGAKGIMAPKCSVSAAPGWSEEEGNYIDLTFGVLHGMQDYWYKKFVHRKA